MKSTSDNRRTVVSLAKSGTHAPKPTGTQQVAITTTITADTLAAFQHSLKTSDKHIKTTLTLDPDSGFTPDGRALMLRSLPREAQVSLPFPVKQAHDPEAAVDTLQRMASKVVHDGIQAEAEAAAELLQGLIARDTLGEDLATAVLDALDALAEQGIVAELSPEFTQGTPAGGTELAIWEYLRQSVINKVYPTVSTAASHLLDVGPRYLDDRKWPKLLLFKGRPPQHTFDLEWWQALGEHYGPVTAKQSVDLWLTQAARVPGLPSSATTAHPAIGSLDELRQSARQAESALQTHRQDQANKDALQLQSLASTVQGLAPDDQAIALSLKHGFDPGPHCVAALQGYWVKTVKSLGLPPGFALQRVQFVSDEDDESCKVSASPTLGGLTVYDALMKECEREEMAGLLPKSGPKVTVLQGDSPDTVAWEYIQVEGLIPPIFEQPDDHILLITLRPGVEA